MVANPVFTTISGLQLHLSGEKQWCTLYSRARCRCRNAMRLWCCIIGADLRADNTRKPKSDVAVGIPSSPNKGNGKYHVTRAVGVGSQRCPQFPVSDGHTWQTQACSMLSARVWCSIESSLLKRDYESDASLFPTSIVESLTFCLRVHLRRLKS